MRQDRVWRCAAATIVANGLRSKRGRGRVTTTLRITCPRLLTLSQQDGRVSQGGAHARRAQVRVPRVFKQVRRRADTVAVLLLHRAYLHDRQ